jgi:hypothetical protein
MLVKELREGEMKSTGKGFPRAAIALTVITTVAIGGTTASEASTYISESKKLGGVAVHVYADLAEDGRPTALGVYFGADVFDGLPEHRNTTSRCFDLNNDSKLEMDECEGDLELVLEFPREVADRLDIPFKWMGVNWNAEGHPPADVYDVPHFDFHFYMVSKEAIDGIRAGPCGFFMHCEDFKRATKPVPQKYVHPEHINVDAAVVRMGNHLVNSVSPELQDPPEIFTHTFIFGAYDGHITFYEPMITREFLLGRPNMCVPIKQPQAWEIGGYYPTRYCMRYLEDSADYAISLEGFVRREVE